MKKEENTTNAHLGDRDKTKANLDKTIKSTTSMHDIDKVQVTQGSFTERKNFEFSHEQSFKSSERRENPAKAPKSKNEAQLSPNNRDISVKSQQDYSLYMRSCDINANKQEQDCERESPLADQRYSSQRVVETIPAVRNSSSTKQELDNNHSDLFRLRPDQTTMNR